MAFLDLTNDEVQGSNFELLADGEYEGTITDAIVKDTKKGGKMIECVLTLKTNSGERKLFEMFNIVNDNPKAQEIGRGKIKTILVNAGKGTILQSVSDLCGVPVRVNVGTRDEEYNGNVNKRNYVKTYKKCEELPFWKKLNLKK